MTAATGWRLVPVEAIENMVEAATENLIDQYDENRSWDDAKDVIERLDTAALYRAMLSAAPQPGVTAEEIAQLIEPEADHWIENAAWAEDRSAWRRRKAEALTKAQAVLSLFSGDKG